MGEWIGFVMVRQAQMNGMLASQVYHLYMIFGAVLTAGGTCGLVRLLVEAIRRSGLSEKEACYAMDVSPSLWANQKAGNGKHVSMQRISHLPATTLQEFAWLIWEELGPPKRAEVGAAVLLAMQQKPRMAKAQLEEAVG